MKRFVKRLLGLQPPSPPQSRNKHLWSIGVYSGPSPTQLTDDRRISNPVITREQVTDIPAAIVADPFLLRVGPTWYMFFEALNRTSGRGEIGVAISPDLISWNYQQVVLREPFHLSYPSVFEWMGDYYMVPETNQTRTIRLYKAEAFPLRWSLVHTIMSGQRFSDTTVFRHGGMWWLFTDTSPDMKHDTLRLFYAADLQGTWTEHPSSPIHEGDPHAARPGGSVVSSDGTLTRFAQDCSPRYGLAVQAFEITTLTTTEYAERPVAGNPVLKGSGAGWNEAGMHHLDAHCLAPGRWVAAVDGWSAATAAQIAGKA